MKDDKKYWMKRRRYGWGWTPTTWQGWLFVVLQISIIFASILLLPLESDDASVWQITGLLVITALVAASLFLAGMFIAPKPHWRWGKKPTDNPDEDF